MNTLDIGIDLDGVCYDFTGSLRHYLIEHEGHDPDALVGGGHEDWDHATWQFYKECWGWSTEEFLAACDRGVDAGILFLHGEPFEGTVGALWNLKNQGHRLHVITSRSFGSRSHHNTSEWLSTHQIPFDSLIFTPHKGVFRPDVMIDDYEKNFYEMSAQGVVTFLYDRPWNRHVDTKFRVAGWPQFVANVEFLANHPYELGVLKREVAESV